MAEALILGCATSGKTLLVRQLRGVAAARMLERGGRRSKTRAARAMLEQQVSIDTRSTVGVELDECGDSVMLREVGAAMAPMWPAFFAACAVLVFVVDASDMSRLPEAAVELWSLLGAERLKATPVLLVLSKSDLPSMLAPDTVLGYLRLEDARAAHGAAIDFIVASLVDRESCAPILDWIENKCAPNR
eukprot:g1945.t1